MTFIETTDPADASREIDALYRQEQGRLDYLPNYARVFCHRPKLMQAWAELQAVLKEPLDERTYWLICLAAAQAGNGSYCALAFGNKLTRKYFSAEQLAAIVRGNSDSPLSAAERATLALARQVAVDASAVTEQQIASLREAGVSDQAIFDIVAAAAARCFFSRIPDALGAQPDAALAGIGEPLLSLLATGRPVETEGK